MLLRVSEKFSDRERHVLALGIPFPPELIQGVDEISASNDAVVPIGSRHAAAVTVLAEDPGRRKPVISAYPGNDTNRQLLRFQDGSLLDVHLQKRRDVRWAQIWLAGSQPVGIAAAGAHVLGKGFAGIGTFLLLADIRSDLAKRRLAAKEGRGEPDAFLGPNSHHRDVTERPASTPAAH